MHHYSCNIFTDRTATSSQGPEDWGLRRQSGKHGPLALQESAVSKFRSANARSGWVERGVCVSNTDLLELKCLKSQLYSFRQREGEACQEPCPIPGPLKELSVGTAAPTAE